MGEQDDLEENWGAKEGTSGEQWNQGAYIYWREITERPEELITDEWVQLGKVQVGINEEMMSSWDSMEKNGGNTNLLEKDLNTNIENNWSKTKE